MSREDWLPFEERRRERKRAQSETAAERRRAFSEAHLSGRLPHITRHHETHYSAILGGDRLDIWPGPQKWRWRNVTYGPDRSLREWLRGKAEEGIHLGH